MIGKTFHIGGRISATVLRCKRCLIMGSERNKEKTGVTETERMIKLKGYVGNISY